MARRPKPWYRKARRAWFVTIDGTQHNLGPDKKAAYERFYELLGQPRQRRVSSQSLAALMDVFLDWVSKHRAADTYEWYRSRLERFARRYPDLTIKTLKPFHVQQWLDSLEGLADGSKRNYGRAIKRCMRWAEAQGYIDRSPIAHLELPRGGKREVAFSQEEFDRLMSYIRNENFADLLRVTWETGCRPQESLQVEAHHVDLDHQRWVLSQSEAKGKKQARVVYLTDEAMAITRRQMLIYPEGPIFRNTNGRPWTTTAVNCAFQAIRVRMGKEEMAARGEVVSDEEIANFTATLKTTKVVQGRTVEKNPAVLRAEAKRKLTRKRAKGLVPSLCMYDLRHSWATRAMCHLDPVTISVLMGHADVSMLANTYQHLSLNPEHMLDQAKKAAG